MKCGRKVDLLSTRGYSYLAIRISHLYVAVSPKQHGSCYMQYLNFDFRFNLANEKFKDDDSLPHRDM